MKKKNLMDESVKDKLVHNILRKFVKEKRPDMKEYAWDDGFWCYGNDDEIAEQKHQEWLNKNK